MDYVYMPGHPIDDLLKCKICRKPFVDPVTTPDDQDRYCRLCITGKVSFIDTLIPITAPIILDMLNSLLVLCPDCQKENIRRIDYQEHLVKECPKRVVLCKASDLKCPWNGSHEQYSDHVNQCTFEFLRPILSDTIQYPKLFNQQQDQINELKMQIEQYEDRVNKLQNDLEDLMEKLNSKNQFETNIQQSYEELSKALENLKQEFETNSVNDHSLDERYINFDKQIKELKKQDTYRTNEITYMRQLSDQHQVQILLLARKPCVVLNSSSSLIKTKSSENLDFISTYKSQAEIILNGKRLEDHDMQSICQAAIIDKQCRKLQLKNCSLNDKSATILASTLYNDTSLTELYLSNNNISDIGVHGLALILSINNSCTLKKLDLHSNNITDEGIGYLADMLKTNKSLDTLDLSDNRITDRGVKDLTTAITCYNDTLHELVLSSNEFIGDASVNNLIEMLRENRSLRVLWLTDCHLSPNAQRQLKQVTTLNPDFTLRI